MDISLDLVVDAANRRLAALTPEVAGYIVLLATRQLEPQPSQLALSSVFLTEVGDVHVRPQPAASDIESEAALRELLAVLLRLSAFPAPAITAVAEQRPGAGLRELERDLSAALIPINHAAARRALARLYRETQRAYGVAVESAAPPLAPAVTPAPSDVDGVSELTPNMFDTPPLPDETLANERERTPDELTPVLGTTTDPFDTAGQRPLALPDVAPYFRVGDMSELEIEVDVDPEPEPFLPSVTPRELPRVEPRSVPAAALLATQEGAAPRPSECRSDVQELLFHFLSHTRSDEQMRQTLRAMIGLDAGGLLDDDRRPRASG